mgnify:FL=1|tara:strand:- start:481 stop:699 length:219 start_codon:yes stop_codon:yes gene_type:complete
MGKMKELYMDLQQGYNEELKLAYIKAIQENNDTVFVHGRQVSKAYAEYLLQFEDTFLKQLKDDKICNNNDES